MSEERGKKEEQQQSQEKKSEPKSEKKNTGIVIGIIVGVISLQVIMLFVFFQVTKPPDQKAAEEKTKHDSLKHVSVEQTEIGMILETPVEAIVNIAGTDGTRFLKVTLKIEFDEKKYPKLGEALEQRQPKLKDLLIEQLSSITLEQIQDSDIRNQIRKEFFIRVNTSLPKEEGQISNVYLNDFIIQ
ncbi:MAG: flagellar basal body-associated FliL family protein [Chitinivibrionales bacterium]|nr:flagellar basal body-associated FliL family protein [Chitinivibrionales bacterium]